MRTITTCVQLQPMAVVNPLNQRKLNPNEY